MADKTDGYQILQLMLQIPEVEWNLVYKRCLHKHLKDGY